MLEVIIMLKDNNGNKATVSNLDENVIKFDKDFQWDWRIKEELKELVEYLEDV